MPSRYHLRDVIGVACRAECRRGKRIEGRLLMSMPLGRAGLNFNGPRVLQIIGRVVQWLVDDRELIPAGVRVDVPGAREAADLVEKDIAALADHITKYVVEDLEAAGVTVTE